MLLLGVSQEVAKKETWTFPPRPPCLPPFYDERRGFLFWQKSSILGAYIARPRWVCRRKDLSLPRRGRRLGDPLVRWLAFVAGGARFFALCVAIRSYCATVSRAERNAFYATSWHFPRSSQERNQGVPPWIPLVARRFKINGGDFCFGKSPPSWAHISHAQDGFVVGKKFCFPVLFEICASRGA